MTEPRDTDPFEARFADRVRAYTEPATERRVDAIAISRAAMSSLRANGWSKRRLSADLLGWRIGGLRWAVAFAAVLIGVVGAAILGRSSDSNIGLQPTPVGVSTPGPAASASGPVPDDLRHSWQRPYAVAPGMDQWPTGFLVMASERMDFGPEPGPAASRSAISAAGLDTLVATATAETKACAVGTVGVYRWSLEGKGTVMTLTAVGADACAAREEALAGPWVRSDLPVTGPLGPALAPGTYFTSAFDPFRMSREPGQLSYTVPEGWTVEQDEPGTVVLHHLLDAPSSERISGVFVALFVQPRIAADVKQGTVCGPVGAEPGVGSGIDDVVAAIVARPGVVSTPPAAVTIGGMEGQLLDLHLAPSWTAACEAPEGPVVGMPILVEAGSTTGPVAGIGRDIPLRVILLDLGGERTMAIVIFTLEPTQSSTFEDRVAEVMPVIEGFEFHPPAP
jgi:hypothetical protein